MEKQALTQFVDHDFNASLVHYPVYCENKNDDPNMHGLHAHQGFEFHFSFTSKGLMLVEDREYDVLPGKVFIIRPQVYHSIQPLQKTVYKRTVLSIEEEYMRGLMESDEEIVSLNIPTGVPLVYEFDDTFQVVNRYYLGDQEKIRKAAEAVAAQAARKK